MGISIVRHEQHLSEWIPRFGNYKKKWPKNLFRHEPIENAIKILKNGFLSSRSDAENSGAIINDIAPVEIISNRADAHASVRLYFRPRTPTQFHIEGIRKPDDFYMGRHAGFLVFLVFDSRSVLTMPTTRFSTGNMQSPTSTVLDGDDGFDQLDFSGIYHDEAYPSDDEKRKRCAEVLADSPLNLDQTLKHIIVRTDADVSTMKFRLIQEGLGHLAPMVKKSFSTGVFFQRYTAVDYVDIAPSRVNFRLMGTSSIGKIKTRVAALGDEAAEQFTLFEGELDPYVNYYIEHTLPPKRYRLLIYLEDCYAHESHVLLIHS